MSVRELLLALSLLLSAALVVVGVAHWDTGAAYVVGGLATFGFGYLFLTEAA